MATAGGAGVSAAVQGGSDPAEVPPAVHLRVLTHVYFKGRAGLMANKIRHHSSKKSKKVCVGIIYVCMCVCMYIYI